MFILVKAVSLFFDVLYFLILLRVLISWIPGINRYSTWVRMIDDLTDPIMQPIQRFTYRYINLGMIDISPIIAIFVLNIIRNIIMRMIFMFF